ncbi:hypothetical protein OEZ85_013026 [Tetradesmus obliquus]|uniref:Tudor domain-containing protein n=1 Tax=Tetradesmus obliquus TaxID=3088 RepID=A0ABY8U4F7_TETOB|nr:hypothetical protein OEZ85_013026 [Tetradesmus obliquus]
MASAAVVDCRPLRDTGTTAAAGSGALASLRTAAPHDAACGGGAPQSPLSIGANSGQRTPGSARGKGMQPAYALQLYAIEAVGRKCSVMQSRSGVKAWEKAQILEYNPESGQHKLRYNSSKAEEWLCLGDIKFKWSQLLPPTAPANPSYRPEFAREGGVGRRLRVYWPAMQRWYQGTVRSYDPKTDRHVVLYKDGDTQSLQLKHEPVIWSDDDAIPAAAANGSSNGTDQQQQQQQQQQQPPLGQHLAPLAINTRHSSSTANTPRAGAAATPRGAPGAAGSTFTTGRPGVASSTAGAAKRGVSPRAPMSPRSAAAAAAAAVALSFAGTSSKAKLNRTGSRGGAAGAGRGGGRHAAAAGAGAAGTQLLRPGAAKHAAFCNGTADGVAVYWRLDRVYYKGKLTSFSPQSGRFTIRYDDGGSEALLLERERFAWHSPRAASAGYRPALHSLMQQLGAEGIAALPQTGEDGRAVPETAGPEGAPHPPISGPGAVGWRLLLYWPADQAWHEAEVLSHDEARRQHHLLFLDGEEEWADLSREHVVWLRATRPGALSAGIVTGDEVPKGRDAVGWRVAVYWKDDHTFYEGTLADYEPSSARHKVQYVDGEQEWLALRNERVIWRLPPKDDSSSDDDGGSSNDEAGGLLVAGHSDGEGGMRRSRKRRFDLERTRSDSGSASSGHGRQSGLLPGPQNAAAAAAGDDSLFMSADSRAAGAAAAAAAGAGDRTYPQSSLFGGAGDASGLNALQLSIKRGGAGSVQQ